MFELLSIKEGFTLGLLLLFMGLSQTAGIGGGPIINLCLMLNYQSKISISLTYIFLIGGSLASVWKNSRKINKRTGLSNVSLELILVTLPMINSGAVLGVMGKNFLSELWVTVLFVLIFLYLIRDITKSLRKISSRPAEFEQHTDRALKEANPSNTEICQKTGESVPIKNVGQSCKKPVIELRTVILVSVAYYFATVLISVIKGGPHLNPLLPFDPCGFVSYAIVLSHVGMSYLLSMSMIQKIVTLREKQSEGPESNHQPQLTDHGQDTDEIPINSKNKHKLVMAGLGAGVLGAALAIGGAPILIPIWLKSGISHETASSTTPALILTSSLISFTLSALNGGYEQTPSYKLIIFGIISFASTALIKDLFTYLAQKYRIRALVVVLLLVVLVVSLLVLVPYQLRKMVDNYAQFTQFGVFC